jgi:archaellum component FlaG (FlaF/FlaG flagellin family)
MSLPTGRHTLTVQADGYEVARRIFNVPGDASLYIPLVRNTGALLLTSVPTGALVFIDGQQEGRTPITVHLSLGTHRIVWVDGTGDQHQETVEVQSGIQARGYRFQ